MQPNKYVFTDAQSDIHMPGFIRVICGIPMRLGFVLVGVMGDAVIARSA